MFLYSFFKNDASFSVDHAQSQLSFLFAGKQPISLGPAYLSDGVLVNINHVISHLHSEHLHLYLFSPSFSTLV